MPTFWEFIAYLFHLEKDEAPILPVIPVNEEDEDFTFYSKFFGPFLGMTEKIHFK